MIGHIKDSRTRTFCVVERGTGHRTDHRTLDRSQNTPQDGLRNRLLDTADKLNCYSLWSGQLDLIIVLMCVWLRAYQLTVIIIVDY